MEELQEELERVRSERDELRRLLQYAQTPAEPEISTSFPEWFASIAASGRRLQVREWDREDLRLSDGFMGTDLCHSKSSSPVHIVEYVLIPSSEPEQHPFPSLHGLVRFRSSSESHKGLCHGGSACAVMDDALGWMGFCVSGEVRPWSGFTAQVDTSLRRPVRVGSEMLLEARVVSREKARKVWVAATLMDGVTREVYAEGKGLFLTSQ